MRDQKTEDPKLVIVYFASGAMQWVKSGTTNQWTKNGGNIHKFYEGKVYTAGNSRKIKIKQHFKLLNTVFMDMETGEFLETSREDLLTLQPHEKSTVQHCKWSEVDWKPEIVLESPKSTRKPPRNKDTKTAVSEQSTG
jgi:hypothetical protein